MTSDIPIDRDLTMAELFREQHDWLVCHACGDLLVRDPSMKWKMAVLGGQAYHVAATCLPADAPWWTKMLAGYDDSSSPFRVRRPIWERLAKKPRPIDAPYPTTPILAKEARRHG